MTRDVIPSPWPHALVDERGVLCGTGVMSVESTCKLRVPP